MKKYLPLLLPVFYSIGCAISVPMHELSTPETLGPWGFRFAFFTGSAPSFVTPSATTIPTQTAYTMPIAGYHFGIGLTNSLQLNGEVFGGGVGSAGSSVALKYQFNGANYFAAKAGNFSTALTLRYWNSDALSFNMSKVTTSATYPYADLNAKGYDATFSVGKRFWDSIAGYVGLKAVSGNLEAKYKNTETGSPVSTDSRVLTGGGAVIGLNTGFKGDKIGIDFTMEAELMSLPATTSSEKTTYSSFMVMGGIPFRF